jgi:hypothetical protein
MQKFSNKVCFIILLVLVATSCMAQAAAIEKDAVGSDDVLEHLINKRQTCIGYGNPCGGGLPGQCCPNNPYCCINVNSPTGFACIRLGALCNQTLPGKK